jgi:hypothetical protein
LDSVRLKKAMHWSECVQRDFGVSGELEGKLDLISAGSERETEGYASKLQELNWDKLYAEHDLGAYIELLRTEWTEQYDLVLIDSRTGLTDSGAICTAQLPDALVVVLTTNEQGLSGILDIARRIERARQRLPYERGRLVIVPVVSRFDSREEYDLARTWKARLTEDLRGFYSPWLNARMPASRALDLCCLPYVSKWGFGEQLAVLSETARTPEFITYYLENIASLLSMGFVRTEYFCDNPDAYVELAKRQAAPSRRAVNAESGSRFPYDLFISYRRRSDQELLANDLRTALQNRGYRVFLDKQVPAGELFPDTIGKVLNDSQHFVLLVGDQLTDLQQDEAFTFIKQSVEERSARTMIPVLLGSADPNKLPSVLANTRYIDARSGSADIAAEELDKRLRTFSQAAL